MPRTGKLGEKNQLKSGGYPTKSNRDVYTITGIRHRKKIPLRVSETDTHFAFQIFQESFRTTTPDATLVTCSCVTWSEKV